MRTSGNTHIHLLMVGAVVFAVSARAATPLGAAFTHQRQLKQNGGPINGTVACCEPLGAEAEGHVDPRNQSNSRGWLNQRSEIGVQPCLNPSGSPGVLRDPTGIGLAE